MPGGAKLGHKQEAAVAALLSSPSLEEAARKCSVSLRTLKNWLRRPEFRAAYTEAQRQLLERTIAGLVPVGGKAVQRLEHNLTCGNPAAENRADELILSYALKGVELLDHAEQIAELRRRMEELKSGEQGRGTGAGEAEGRTGPDDGGPQPPPGGGGAGGQPRGLPD